MADRREHPAMVKTLLRAHDLRGSPEAQPATGPISGRNRHQRVQTSLNRLSPEDLFSPVNTSPSDSHTQVDVCPKLTPACSSLEAGSRPLPPCVAAPTRSLPPPVSTHKRSSVIGDHFSFNLAAACPHRPSFCQQPFNACCAADAPYDVVSLHRLPEPLPVASHLFHTSL